MKTASKVFIILGIVGTAISTGLWLTVLFVSIYDYVLPIGIATVMFIFSIVGLVVGILSLVQLNTAIQKKELTAYAVCCLIFCNLVAGILLLCLQDSDLVATGADNQIVEDNHVNTTSAEPNQATKKVQQLNNTTSVIEKLQQLKSLKDSEIITEEEFIKMKTDLLNKF